MYDLIISNHAGTESKRYETLLAAIDAVDEAAAIDGLTARYGCTHLSGFLIDKDNCEARFHFEILRRPNITVDENGFAVSTIHADADGLTP
jgi:hypothetical protein